MNQVDGPKTCGAYSNHGVQHTAVKVLVDTNLLSWALRAEGVVKEETLLWGGKREVRVEVHGYRGKKLPKGEWQREQISALPTVARLAREGRITLFSSMELDFEAFRGSRPFKGMDGDIFAGLKIYDAPAAVERSYFWKTIDLDRYSDGDEFAGWCKKFLLQMTPEFVAEILELMPDLPGEYRRGLLNIGRYQKICKNLNSDDHVRDAFHLWTAEENGLDYFLTGDKRFINVITQSSKIELIASPISPAALLSELDVAASDPLPLVDREFKYYFGGPQLGREPGFWTKCRRLGNKTRKAVWLRMNESGD